MSTRFPAIFLALLATALPLSAQTSRGLGTTAYGVGTFESRGVHAELNRASVSLAPGGAFSMTVSGRMGWTYTGHWTEGKDGIALTITGGGSGSGKIKLGGSPIREIRLSGNAPGGSFKVRFTANATRSTVQPREPLPVALPPAVATARPRETSDETSSQSGRGSFRYTGDQVTPLSQATVTLEPSGAARMRLSGGGEHYLWSGTWQQGSGNTVGLSLRNANGGRNDTAHGYVLLHRKRRYFERIEIAGTHEGTGFVAAFESSLAR